MPKYTVRATFRVSGTLEVTADNEEDALSDTQMLAESLGVPGLAALDEEFDDVEIEG